MDFGKVFKPKDIPMTILGGRDTDAVSDYSVREHIDLKSGTIQRTPTATTDIPNKAYVDAQLGGGTVTSVSVTTLDGVSGTVATATTTPAISISLANIRPRSVYAIDNISGANLSGTNTGDQTNITGNAATVTTNANLTGPITSVGNATTVGLNAISESHLVLIDNTLRNASTTAHGFLPKLSNVSTEYLNGTGAWSTPAGGTRTLISSAWLSGASNFVMAVPTGYRFLELYENIWGGAFDQEIRLTFNGIGGTSYDYRLMTGSAIATTSNAASIVLVPNSTNARGGGGIHTIGVEPMGTNGHHFVVGNGMHSTDQSSFIMGDFRNANTLSSMTIAPAAGTISGAIVVYGIT